MKEQFSRTQLLIGKEGLDRLAAAHVAVFGVGGVGGFAAEALARGGIGAIDLIDDDKVCASNLNRQIIALHSTVGMYKVDAAERRIHDICPEITVRTYKTFYMPDTADMFDFSRYDYIIDAIDTVTGKITLAVNAQAAGVPIISSMGAGNKLDPTAFEIADIYSTSVCPLARVMRRELKKRGIRRMKTVYSKEPPIAPLESEKTDIGGDAGSMHSARRSTPGSVSFVPSAAGLIIAGEVIKDIAFARVTEELG